MRRPVEFLADMLPLDEAGRRAVDETLADWRCEANDATTSGGRLLVDVIGTAAVVGAITRLAFDEVRMPGSWQLFARVVGLALTVSAMIAMIGAWSTLAAAEWPTAVTLLVALLPITLGSYLPLVALTPPFRLQRGVPVLGVCLLLGAIAAANLGWVTPVAKLSFRVNAVDVLAAHVREAPVPRSDPERSVPALAGRAMAGGFDGASAAYVLSERAALGATAPAFLLLGIQARRFSRHRRWRHAGGLLAWAVAAVAAVPAVLAVTELRDWLQALFFYPANELRLLQFWVVPAVALVAAGLMARRSPASTTIEAKR